MSWDVANQISLQVPDEQGTGTQIQLVNPAGLQLVTQSHFMRAADRRFGEPEDLVAESLEYCRQVVMLPPLQEADLLSSSSERQAVHRVQSQCCRIQMSCASSFCVISASAGSKSCAGQLVDGATLSDATPCNGGRASCQIWSQVGG